MPFTMQGSLRYVPLAVSLVLGAASAALGQVGCESDSVLPNVAVPSICGNGVVETGEQCDNTSAGCVSCQIAPEWKCPDNVCTVDCDDPGVESTGLYCARKSQCNMAGWWAVRETDFTGPIESILQESTQWYLYHVVQLNGSPSYAIDTALDCGVHVTGGANVDYTQGTENALIWTSGIDEPPHGPRKGTAKPAAGGGCDMSLDRFFFIRGATNTYLPTNFDNDATLPSNPAEPWLGAPPLPVQTGSNLMNDTHFPPGAVTTGPDDDSGVSYPGASFRISGTIDAIRHSAQRDYKGYASTTPVPAGALSFTYFGNYSLQESVFAMTECNVVACGLASTVVPPAIDHPPYVTFSFIGSDMASSRSSSVIVGQPKQDKNTDLATCQNIKAILPHFGSIHDGSPPSGEPDASVDGP